MPPPDSLAGEKGATSSAAPMELVGLNAAQFQNAAVRLVGQFGESQQIFGIEAVAGVPVAFLVAVTAFKADRMESAVFRDALPDTGADQSNAQLGNGWVGGGSCIGRFNISFGIGCHSLFLLMLGRAILPTL